MLFHLATLLVTCFLSKEAECADSRNIGYLLPGNIIPSHYDLRWIFTDDCSDKPEFNFDRTFSGSAQITMKAIKPGVEVIEMNAKNLTFSSATLSFGNGYRDVKLQPAFYGREEKVLFQLPFKLPVFQTVKLNIVFQGKILRKPHGMFVSNETMVERNNRTYKMPAIGTILQAAYARSVFPCFDEPRYKASFNISVNVSQCVLQKGYLVFSNTPLKKTERRNGRAIMQFEKSTVNMSTFVVGLAIGPFASTPTQRFNSSYPDASKTEWKDLKTWGMKSFVDSPAGRLVENASVRFMEIFTNDFGIGYPLKKLDQINIIPVRRYGVMNWGVVLYRLQRSSFLNLLRVSRELSHQWFGNLVTCHWWSDIWLNEGFGSYYAAYATNKFSLENPNAKGWNIPAHSVYNLIGILGEDFGRSRPLSYWVEDPKSFPHLNNRITFRKGAAVIRMWSSVLGEKAFLKAIHKYLDDRKFNVATPAHLFKAFDSVANESLSDFGNGLPSKYFPKWTTQSGYPIVTVTRSPNNMLEYILTQKQFRPAPDSPPSYWTVPISYSTSAENNFNKTHAMLWLRDDDDNNNSTAVITLPKPVNWIIVNNKFTGYYRVNYDQENWEALAEVLGNRKTYHTIPVENRMQIITDLFGFASENSSVIDFSLVMNMLLYLQHESDYSVWDTSVIYVLAFMDVMMSKSKEFYGYFQTFVNDLVDENYSRLGFWPRGTDSYNEQRLRVDIVEWACRMENPQCVNDSNNYINSFAFSEDDSFELKQIKKLYSTAYCTYIRNSDYNWDELWKKYKSAKHSMEKRAILAGITCSEDKNIVKRLLMETIQPSSRLKNSEKQVVIRELLRNDPMNTNIVLEYFAENYKEIADLYSGNLADPLSDVALRVGTAEELDKMYNIIDILKNDPEIGLPKIDRDGTLGKARASNDWFKRNSNSVIMWLTRHYGGNETN